jgi:hypothetical protein
MGSSPSCHPADHEGDSRVPLIELIDDAKGADSAIGQVTCPNCQVVMRLGAMKPVEGAGELREAAYRCPRCDAETKRWVKL